MTMHDDRLCEMMIPPPAQKARPLRFWEYDLRQLSVGPWIFMLTPLAVAMMLTILGVL